MIMNNAKVIKLLDDWESTRPDLYPLVARLYKQVKQHAPNLMEQVKYGGILFSQTEAESSGVCGLFMYSSYVSLEFSQGVQLNDPQGQLQGSGKYRRHLKFKTLDDLEQKQPLHFVKLALQIT
jgi:hypothetical protein